MNRKIKVGILLLLIGVGIPLVLFFFQEDGKIWLRRPSFKTIERKLTPDEVKAIEEKMEKRRSKKSLTTLRDDLAFLDEFREPSKAQEVNKVIDYYQQKFTIQTREQLSIPYRYFIGVGFIPVLIGIGIFMFSFFQEEVKLKK